MSSTRWGRNWADVDEEDEDGTGEASSPTVGGSRFETAPNEDGIKTVIEYIERDGKTSKVTKKVRVRTITKWTNKAMDSRKDMTKFGKAATADPAEEALHVKQVDDEIKIELSKKHAVSLAVKDDAEDKFLEESLKICANLFKEKKVWTDVNRDKQIDREEDKKPEEKKPEDAAAAQTGKGNTPAKYVPPSLRDNAGKGGGKDYSQEASLRVTNLSEDVKEGDLQEIFGRMGRLQRVYLAKHMDTMQSKGFAFITYYSKEDAQRAIDKLNGWGYDNLILQVQWAKPRT